MHEFVFWCLFLFLKNSLLLLILIFFRNLSFSLHSGNPIIYVRQFDIVLHILETLFYVYIYTYMCRCLALWVLPRLPWLLPRGPNDTSRRCSPPAVHPAAAGAKWQTPPRVPVTTMGAGSSLEAPGSANTEQRLQRQPITLEAHNRPERESQGHDYYSYFIGEKTETHRI